MSELLERLRGRLIVSVQAAPETALDDPAVLAAMAAAAVEGGAAGVRIQGTANLKAVRARVRVPILGLIKRQYDGFEPYITPTVEDVRAVVAAGADIVAFDATARTHPDGTTVAMLAAAAHAGGVLAMADCALATDAREALAGGADIIATTLAGYTEETRGCVLPALDVLKSWRTEGAFRICEGGVHSPQDAARAIDAGADAVVIGTAITNVGWLTAQYARAIERGVRRA